MFDKKMKTTLDNIEKDYEELIADFGNLTKLELIQKRTAAQLLRQKLARTQSLFTKVPYFLTAGFAILAIAEGSTSNTSLALCINLLLLLLVFTAITLWDLIQQDSKNSSVYKCELIELICDQLLDTSQTEDKVSLL